MKKSDGQLNKYFKFELAQYLLSLIDELGMRKTQKAKLYDSFKPVKDKVYFGRHIHTIDGGFLLHRINWQQNARFTDIILMYTHYLKRELEAGSVIIFDGYPETSEESGTINSERLRRMGRQMSPGAHFTEYMSATMPTEKFLSNEKNKVQLINLLTVKFVAMDFFVLQAAEDADTMIHSSSNREICTLRLCDSCGRRCRPSRAFNLSCT